jgi:raffinose/stachyose/melibiose transport system substrate-binding protein
MKKIRKQTGAAFLAVLLLLLPLTGCSSGRSRVSQYQKSNDIVTFTAPEKGKKTVRIAFAMNVDWESLISALNRQFPDRQFIYDFYATAGNSPSIDTVKRIVQENDYDFVVANAWYAPLLGADISSEAFLDNYLQTTLDSLAVDGHVYGIPLPSSAQGIYYNKTLFAEHGWEVPASVDDFISLCGKIKAAGVVPFDACLKYESQTVRVLTGILYDQLFRTQKGMGWYSDLVAGKATFAGYAEPMFQMAERLFKEGVFSKDSFTASLTDMRRDFFAGKLAMIDYSSDLLSLAKAENCGFEIGLAPYPSATGEHPGVFYSANAVLYIPSGVKNNASRFASDTAVMKYLSTSEGQDALLTGWTGVVSLKNYAGTNQLYKDVASFIESGSYHAILAFSPSPDLQKALQTQMNTAVKKIGEGTKVEDAVAELDRNYASVLKEGVPARQYETIAQAADRFTVLETSYYIADKLKQATGADIALVPNGNFYCSNMADIPKGDITNDLRLFYQKGIADKNFVTTYELTGAKLKELLEHPVINGKEQTQFIAAAGLSLEYAPWHKSGNRFIKAALPDGTALEDAKSYTVAAYDGVIDKRFIASGLRTFEDLGSPQAFIEKALRADGKISPDIRGRVKLDWDIQ